MTEHPTPTPERAPRWLALLVDTRFGEFLLYDVVISSVIGVAIWLTDRSETGIIAFFLSLTIFMMIKLYGEVVRAHDLLTGAVRDIRTDLGRVVEANRALLTDAQFFQAGSSIVRSYASLLSQNDAMFVARSRYALSQCQAYLRRLRAGELYVDGRENFHAVMSSFVAATTRAAFFTSYVKTDPFWSGGAGRAYRDLNLARARDGVQMLRVFIVDDMDNIPPDVSEIIREEMNEPNFGVRIALASHVGRDALHDMAIFDERYAGFLEFVPNSRDVRALRVFNTVEDVTQAIEIRDRVMADSIDARSLLKTP